VQNTSNPIQWSSQPGDPSPISIIVTNPDNSILNGPFSIHEFVNITDGSFTVTNVTLRVDKGFFVNFVNPSNASQIYAQSQPFEVKPPGSTYLL
ncbi:hypothetical protein SISNIDRAFT_420566, partial [Sistotremastrum niveocremeum HHB9708]